MKIEHKGGLVVLKLGGSAITIKEKEMTPNGKVIERLCKEIAEAKPKKLLMVHGGGSFGHPLAKRYRIMEGFHEKSQFLGFAKTHHAMTVLNQLIVKSLLDNGVPAIGIAPSSFIITKKGRIESFDLNVLTEMLKMNFTPVLYGDAVLDSENGFAILSGDQLVSFLAVKLEAERIIIGVDVDGLFTADPKMDDSAELIEEVSPSELEKMLLKIGRTEAVDVTGGMFGKMNELLKAAKHGIPILIVNALKPNKIYKALRGERVVGTLIWKG